MDQGNFVDQYLDALFTDPAFCQELAEAEDAECFRPPIVVPDEPPSVNEVAPPKVPQEFKPVALTPEEKFNVLSTRHLDPKFRELLSQHGMVELWKKQRNVLLGRFRTINEDYDEKLEMLKDAIYDWFISILKDRFSTLLRQRFSQISDFNRQYLQSLMTDEKNEEDPDWIFTEFSQTKRPLENFLEKLGGTMNPDYFGVQWYKNHPLHDFYKGL